MKSPGLFSLTSLGLLALSGCAPVDDEVLGAVSMQLQSVPAGVSCLRIVFRLPTATNDTTRSFAVTANQATTLDLGVLPAGAYTFRANAYGVACGSVVASTVATWVGDAVPATITAGHSTQVAFALRPNVTTTTTVDFIQPVRAIYSGNSANTTYAVMQDGSVRAWGANDLGQIGDGTTSTDGRGVNLPRTVQGLTSPSQIGAARGFACATTQNQGLACWGMQDVGQLGPTVAPRAVPTFNPDLEPLAIAVAYHGVCGDLGGGEWRCWGGLNPSNEGRFFAARATVAPSALGPFAGAPVLLLTEAGRLYNAAPTGAVQNELSSRVLDAAGVVNQYCLVQADGFVACSTDLSSTDDPHWRYPLGLGDVRSLVAGWTHFCALRGDQTARCWGANDMGQLGAALYDAQSNSPVTVPLTGVRQLASGENHTCALLNDGTVWCWGRNDVGQLGDGTNITRFAPVRVRL